MKKFSVYLSTLFKLPGKHRLLQILHRSLEIVGLFYFLCIMLIRPGCTLQNFQSLKALLPTDGDSSPSNLQAGQHQGTGLKLTTVTMEGS